MLALGRKTLCDDLELAKKEPKIMVNEVLLRREIQSPNLVVIKIYEGSRAIDMAIHEIEEVGIYGWPRLRRDVAESRRSISIGSKISQLYVEI